DDYPVYAFLYDLRLVGWNAGEYRCRHSEHAPSIRCHEVVNGPAVQGVKTRQRPSAGAPLEAPGDGASVAQLVAHQRHVRVDEAGADQPTGLAGRDGFVGAVG